MALYDLLGALGQGVSTGVQTYDAMQQRERQQAIEDEDREADRRRQMLEKALLELQIDQTKAGPQPTYGVGADGRPTMSGARDPQQVQSFLKRNPVQPEEPEPINWQTVPTPGGYAQIHPRTGETRPVMGDGGQLAPPPPASSQPRPPSVTESERRAAAVLPRAEIGLREINNFVQQAGGAPGVSAMFSGVGGRFFQSADIQRFRAATRAVVSSFLRWESGANITEGEINEMVEILSPQPGDKPETVALKLQSLEGQMEALRNSAALANNAMGVPESEQMQGLMRGPVVAGDDEQRQMWDAAAATLRQRGQSPESVLGPRP